MREQNQLLACCFGFPAANNALKWDGRRPSSARSRVCDTPPSPSGRQLRSDPGRGDGRSVHHPQATSGPPPFSWNKNLA